MLHRKLEITAPQSEKVDARLSVSAEENPATTETQRWRCKCREIPRTIRLNFQVRAEHSKTDRHLKVSFFKGSPVLTLRPLLLIDHGIPPLRKNTPPACQLLGYPR